MTYKPEIDGLRAIAVLIVLIFHIDPKIIPGGFIGVDVFFVISGFLITSIVTKSINNNSFSYKEFYTKRIKRLLPLFFAVVVFTIISGYFILLPSDFRVFAGDVIASNFFLANVKSAFSSNYFESDQPLLHFWSLAVEEQFYFIMPTLLLLVYKFFRKYLIYILGALFVVSLGLSEYMSMTPKYNQLSYFLLPTRAWELLAGCLLSVTNIKVDNVKATYISYTGLFLIVIGAFIIDKQSVFPGLITLLPVLGTIFLIIGGQNGFGKILSTKPFLFVGLASYSIYMWHWPIIIFLKSVFKIEEFSLIHTLLLSIVIIGVGYLSQKYIEDFFRFMKNINFKKAILYYFIIPLLITSGVSFYVYSNNGLPQRYGLDAVYTTTSTKKCSSLDIGCFITTNKDESKKVVMIGDSHADHFANLFSPWFNDENLSLRLFAAGGCNFYSNNFHSTVCEDAKAKIKVNLENVNTVIIAKRLDKIYNDEVFKNEFKNYVNNLTGSGKDVVIIKQIPMFKDEEFLHDWMNSIRYGSDFDYNNNVVDPEYLRGNEAIEVLFSDNKNVKILDFSSSLLVNEKPSKFDENNMPLYFDSDHLTAHGGEWLYKKIKKDKSADWLVNDIKSKQYK